MYEPEGQQVVGVRGRYQPIADETPVQYFHSKSEDARNRAMYNEFVAGATTKELGEKYKLSRPRIHFIVRRVAARTGQQLTSRELESNARTDN